MTKASNDVRRLMAELADALVAVRRSGQALGLYRDALDETGTRPTQAELHRRIAAVTTDDGDTLLHLIRAVGCDPKVATTAGLAGDLLDRLPELTAPSTEVDQLERAVRAEPEASAAGFELVARLRKRTGDLTGTVDVLCHSWQLNSADRSAELAAALVRLMLEAGQVDRAEEFLAEETDELAGPLPWAELLLAQGRFADARAKAAEAGPRGWPLQALAEIGLGEASTIPEPIDSEDARLSAFAVHLTR